MSSILNLLNPKGMDLHHSPARSSSPSESLDGPIASTSTLTAPSNVNELVEQGNGPSSSHHSNAQGQADALDHKPHDNCPDSLNCLPDTDGKPQHTLPIILRSTILGSKKKKLTIRDIYAEMERKYPYFKTAGPAWKQSVRHHLSLSRLFERQERPASAPGHGSYWTVNLEAPPGTKRPRKRGRGKKEDSAEEGEVSTKKARSALNDTLNDTLDQGPGPSSQIEMGRAVSASNGHSAYGLGFNTPSSMSPPQHAPGNENRPQSRTWSSTSPRIYHPVSPIIPGPPIIGSLPMQPREDDEVRSNPFDPRSPSPFPSPLGPSPSPTSCSTAQEIDRLLEENRELKKEAVSVFSRMARMASDLSDAHSEIARLRTRNESLERQLSNRHHN